MPIYTCFIYQACCDRCDIEHGKYNSLQEAQKTVLNDKNWKLIDGKVYCPKCAEKLLKEE